MCRKHKYHKSDWSKTIIILQRRRAWQMRDIPSTARTFSINLCVWISVMISSCLNKASGIQRNVDKWCTKMFQVECPLRDQIIVNKWTDMTNIGNNLIVKNINGIQKEEHKKTIMCFHLKWKGCTVLCRNDNEYKRCNNRKCCQRMDVW